MKSQCLSLAWVRVAVVVGTAGFVDSVESAIPKL
jgi:hypothetical protein